MSALNSELIRKIRPSRLFQEVALQLYELISKGHLHGGDRLPSEKQLCELFNVSRTSIREALRTLGALGLVEARNGGGSFVKRGSPEAVGTVLSMALFHDLDDVPQIFEARQAIETWTAFHAASRITETQLDELAALVEKQCAEVARGDSGIEADFGFHLLIGIAACNEVVTRLLYSMITLIFKVLDPSRRPPMDLTVAVDQHRGILEALRNGDGDLAMRRMSEHISLDPQADVTRRLPFSPFGHLFGEGNRGQSANPGRPPGNRG